jgi:hypothetical protein
MLLVVGRHLHLIGDVFDQLVGVDVTIVILDGGAFQDGSQTAVSISAALSETHSFSPTLINELKRACASA